MSIWWKLMMVLCNLTGCGGSVVRRSVVALGLVSCSVVWRATWLVSSNSFKSDLFALIWPDYLCHLKKEFSRISEQAVFHRSFPTVIPRFQKNNNSRSLLKCHSNQLHRTMLLWSEIIFNWERWLPNDCQIFQQTSANAFKNSWDKYTKGSCDH